MNDKNTIILFLILLTQIFSTFRLNSINNEIMYLHNENQSLHSHLRNRLSTSIRDINSLITESSSPIRQASFTYGTISIEDLTVEVTFNVVLKELTPTTNVFLEFNDEKVQLSQNNSVFSLSKEIDILTDGIFPLIIIEDNEKEVITQESQLYLYGLRYSIFPEVDVEFSGANSISDQNINVNGQLHVFTTIVDSRIKFKSYKVLYFLNNDIIGQQDIVGPPTQNGDYTVFNLNEFTSNKTIPENALFSIVFAATNDLGLEHHILVSQSSISGNSSDTCWIHNFERIYSPSKELMWQTSNSNNSNCIVPILK
jgi:hypothetical protein